LRWRIYPGVASSCWLADVDSVILHLVKLELGGGKRVGYGLMLVAEKVFIDQMNLEIEPRILQLQQSWENDKGN
jgi:hypothetical protein